MYKVDFNDCTFCEFDKSEDIEYNGKKYHCILIPVIDDNGIVWHYRVAENSLKYDMVKNVGDYDFDLNSKEDEIDNSIAFYCDNNDGVYYILEHILEDEIIL